METVQANYFLSYQTSWTSFISYNHIKLSYSYDLQRQDHYLALSYPLYHRGYRMSQATDCFRGHSTYCGMHLLSTPTDWEKQKSGCKVMAVDLSANM